MLKLEVASVTSTIIAGVAFGESPVLIKQPRIDPLLTTKSGVALLLWIYTMYKLLTTRVKNYPMISVAFLMMLTGTMVSPACYQRGNSLNRWTQHFSFSLKYILDGIASGLPLPLAFMRFDNGVKINISLYTAQTWVGDAMLVRIELASTTRTALTVLP
jgi:hypothetical protein